MPISLTDALTVSPIVAVLRGVTPEEAVALGDALISANVVVLEVTLDSPNAEESLRLLRDACADRAFIAAGTVLRAAQVRPAIEAGAQAIIAPNFSPAVVTETRAAGSISCPGVMTPSEAFAALETGADALKLFPGDAVSPKVVKGLRAVLPLETMLMVTGGVSASNLRDFLDAGAQAVGLGSALFKPGKAIDAVAADAAHFAAAARGSAL